MEKIIATTKMTKENELFILEWMLHALILIKVCDRVEKAILETKIKYMIEDAIVEINKSSFQEK